MKYSLLAASLSAALIGQAAAAAPAPVSPEEQEIEVITVKSQRGLISYVSASGAKSDTPIIETPLSVSVLTEERITDLGALICTSNSGHFAKHCSSIQNSLG